MSHVEKCSSRELLPEANQRRYPADVAELHPQRQQRLPLSLPASATR